MPDPLAPDRRARYRVQLLRDATPTPEGVVHTGERGPELLPWSRVLCALAAEVGEPEGVRTMVFDLVVRLGRRACEVCRFDADPCAGAMEVARAIERGVGPERASNSLKSLAADGMATRWHPDLEELADRSLAELADALRPARRVARPRRIR
jgi:hypothetical protein